MTRLATPAAVRAPNQRSRSFERPSRASRASRRARRATGRARGAREDDDFDDFKADATSRDDDDGARVERRVELSAAQAKIAAVARAIELCASGATREACAIAWEEVEELTSWGGGRREGD